MRMTPVSTVRRLVAVGTKGKEAAEARRIRTVNTAVLFAAVTLVAYAAFHLAFGVATLRPLILILVGFSVLFALFIPLNKLVTPAWTASLFAVAGSAAVIISTAFLGPQGGFQLYLIPVAGLVALMTRGSQWPVLLGCAVLFVAAFIYIHMAFDKGLIAPYNDAVLDGLFIASIIGAVALSLLPALLYRQLVARAEADLQAARDNAEQLLFAILPRPIAHRLGTTDDASEQIIAGRFDSVTVLFADIVGFTSQTAKMQPENVVARLNRLFSDFDGRAQQHGLEKIKTIGDAYWAFTGLPEMDPMHAHKMCKFALQMLTDLQLQNEKHPEWNNVQLRIGIHSGPVLGGVLGSQQISYEVFGETSDIASWVEQKGRPIHVVVSGQTKRCLESQMCGADQTFDFLPHGTEAEIEDSKVSN